VSLALRVNAEHARH